MLRTRLKGPYNTITVSDAQSGTSISLGPAASGTAISLGPAASGTAVSLQDAASGSFSLARSTIAIAPPVVVSGTFVTTGAPATTTATLFAPTVAWGASITTGAPATTVATTFAPTVNGAASVSVTSGAPATTTAATFAPAISVSVGVTSAGPATTTATVFAPSVSYGASVTTGTPATTAATVYAPEVSYGASVTSGAPATTTATLFAPSVSYGASVTTGAPATTTATVYAPTVSTGGGAFTPADLFASAEDGAWYDPSDLSTLAQNSDGTGSASVGDPVGYVVDKSGNGYHATQSASEDRPILRQDANSNYYLEFDGSGDHLVIPSGFSPAANETWIAFSALYPDTADFDNGVCAILSGNSGGTDSGFRKNMSQFVSAVNSFSTANGSANVTTSNVDGTGVDLPYTYTTANHVFTFGVTMEATSPQNHRIGGNTNGSNSYKGKMYGMVIRQTEPSAVDISETETWLGAKAGVTL